MLLIMVGQASGNEPINCQIIAEGICENFIQFDYKTQNECMGAKKTKCLEKGFIKEDANNFDRSISAALNCLEREEIETHCIYIHGRNRPCVNFDIQYIILYCLP